MNQLREALERLTAKYQSDVVQLDVEVKDNAIDCGGDIPPTDSVRVTIHINVGARREAFMQSATYDMAMAILPYAEEAIRDSIRRHLP